MNQQIATFLWRAARRDILTPQQCLVLRELFTEGATIEECVDFIATNRLVTETQVSALRLASDVHARRARVDREDLKAQELEESRLEEAPPPAAVWEPDPGLEWFCYIAVEEGLLTREVCLSLIADLEEASDLLGFAQSVLNCGLIRDMKTVQRLTDDALERWARGGPPPFSVLTEDGPPGMWEKAQ